MWPFRQRQPSTPPPTDNWQRPGGVLLVTPNLDTKLQHDQRAIILFQEARRGYIRARWPKAMCPAALSDPNETRKLEEFQALIIRAYTDGVMRGMNDLCLYLDLLKLAIGGHSEGLC